MNPKPERCPVCNKRFWTQAELRDHVDQEHGVLELGSGGAIPPRGSLEE